MDSNYNTYQNAQKQPCISKETEIRNVQLASAYVPFQKYCGVMTPMESLCRGTAFAELFSPYSKREYVNVEPEVCNIEGLGKGANRYVKR